MSADNAEGQAEHQQRIKRCTSCGAEIIWFKTPAGKSMPVDRESVRPGEYEYKYGAHISHFSTCPDANQHRRR